jgi:hypothetical protein
MLIDYYFLIATAAFIHVKALPGEARPSREEFRIDFLRKQQNTECLQTAEAYKSF